MDSLFSRPAPRSEVGEESEEEEEDVDSGSTSDEEEQEDPRDYCKGNPLSPPLPPSLPPSTLVLAVYRWLPSCGDWRCVQSSLCCDQETRMGSLLYCLAVLEYQVSIITQSCVCPIIGGYTHHQFQFHQSFFPGVTERNDMLL